MATDTFYFYNTFVSNKKRLQKFFKTLHFGHSKKYDLGKLLMSSLTKIFNNGKKKITDKNVYIFLKKKYIDFVISIRKIDKQVDYSLEYFKNKQKPLLCNDYLKSIVVSGRILSLIKDAEKKGHKIDIKSYLDFGPGDGINAQTIGHSLNLRKPKIYCLDIRNMEHRRNLKRLNNKCNIHIYDGNDFDTAVDLEQKPKKINKKSISMITCFQVIHHINEDNIDNIIRQLYDILKDDGILIIKEHDASTKIKDFLQVVHFIWGILEKLKYEKVLEGLGINYFNKASLTKIMKRNSFQKITEIQNKSQVTNNYFALFKKIK